MDGSSVHHRADTEKNKIHISNLYGVIRHCWPPHHCKGILLVCRYCKVTYCKIYLSYYHSLYCDPKSNIYIHLLLKWMTVNSLYIIRTLTCQDKCSFSTFQQQRTQAAFLKSFMHQNKKNKNQKRCVKGIVHWKSIIFRQKKYSGGSQKDMEASLPFNKRNPSRCPLSSTSNQIFRTPKIFQFSSRAHFS